MTKTVKRGVRGAGKVAFWSRKESIKKMLDEKYSLMATFLAHEKEVGISYGQFRIYVNEYIKERPKKENKLDKKLAGSHEKKKTFMEIQETELKDEDVFK